VQSPLRMVNHQIPTARLYIQNSRQFIECIVLQARSGDIYELVSNIVRKSLAQTIQPC